MVKERRAQLRVGSVEGRREESVVWGVTCEEGWTKREWEGE